MKFRFTIGRKIGTGFGILIFLTIVVFFYTKITLDKSKEVNDRIIKVSSPSVNHLQQLKIHIVRSRVFITNWAFFPNSSGKQELIEIIEKGYPKTKEYISKKLATNWSEEEKLSLDKIYSMVDELFSLYDIITSSLSSFESYADPFFKMQAEIMVDEGGDIDTQAKKVIHELDILIDKQISNANKDSDSMLKSFGLLENLVKYLGLALFIGGALIALFTVRSIVKPVQKLRELLLLMGKGIIPKEKMGPRTDEIGDMSLALNDLMVGFKRTTEFANNVGAGNFQSEYQPLSKYDTLGHSLLTMRKDLFDLTSNLEQKVKERTHTIEEQKKEIEMLYTHVTDSIRYAKRIQEAILPPDYSVETLLPNSFVLYKPKDIVSGDFYWVKKKSGKVFFAAIDCTGHGVPGALMTIVGRNGLNQAIERISNPNPASVLDALNEEVGETLHQKEGFSNVKDGMDAALCAIDFKTKELQFAGAYNPLYLIRDGEVEQIKGNKFPIGAFVDETPQKFTNNELTLKKDDVIYIFSDGYADQFGGTQGKKFMYKRFRDILLEIHQKEINEQKYILNETIETWKGKLEQVDDILVIGIKI